MSVTQKDVQDTIIFKDGQEVVRSDKLAKMFEKQHKNVLQVIEQKLSFISGLNYSLKDFFIEDKAITSKGKEFKRYYLTRKGFDFVALSFQGKKADLYKLWYINAFHDKQKVLEENKLTSKLNKDDDLWVKFRLEGIEFRNKLTKVINEHITTYRNKVEHKMNDGRYFGNYTKMIYNSLGIETSKGIPVRDTLDKRMLVRLEDMEDKVADLIEKYAKQDIYYKDVFQIIKKQIGKI